MQKFSLLSILIIYLQFEPQFARKFLIEAFFLCMVIYNQFLFFFLKKKEVN